MHVTTHRAWWAIIVLALVLRLALVGYMTSQGGFGGDTPKYRDAGHALINGEIFERVPAPLYPLILVASERVPGGHGDLVLRLFQTCFGVGIVWLVMVFTRRLFGEREALVAGLVAAVSPTLVFTTSFLYPTVFYTCLLLGATMLVSGMMDRPTWKRGLVLAAVALAAALMNLVFLVPFLALLGWWGIQVLHGRHWRSGIYAAVVGMLVFGGLNVYSGIKESRVGPSKGFMVKGQLTLHLVRTVHPSTGGRRIRVPEGTPFEALGMRDLLAREAGYLKDQPDAWLLDYGSEFLQFWHPMPSRIMEDNAYTRKEVLWIGAIYFTPVLVFSLAGLLLGSWPWSRRVFVALVPLATAALYAYFFSQTRYRIPVEPLVIVLAAGGFLNTMDRLRNRVAVPR